MAEPANRLADAANTYAEAKAHLETARQELWDAIRRADAAGLSQAEIVRGTGFTREHIRRVNRAGPTRASKERSQSEQPS